MRLYLTFRALPVPFCLLMSISYMFENCFCYLPCSSLFIAKEKKVSQALSHFQTIIFMVAQGIHSGCASLQRRLQIYTVKYDRLGCAMFNDKKVRCVRYSHTQEDKLSMNDSERILILEKTMLKNSIN